MSGWWVDHLEPHLRVLLDGDSGPMSGRERGRHLARSRAARLRATTRRLERRRPGGPTDQAARTGGQGQRGPPGPSVHQTRRLRAALSVRGRQPEDRPAAEPRARLGCPLVAAFGGGGPADRPVVGVRGRPRIRRRSLSDVELVDPALRPAPAGAPRRRDRADEPRHRRRNLARTRGTRRRPPTGRMDPTVPVDTLKRATRCENAMPSDPSTGRRASHCRAVQNRKSGRRTCADPRNPSRIRAYREHSLSTEAVCGDLLLVA